MANQRKIYVPSGIICGTNTGTRSAIIVNSLEMGLTKFDGKPPEMIPCPSNWVDWKNQTHYLRERKMPERNGVYYVAWSGASDERAYSPERLGNCCSYCICEDVSSNSSILDRFDVVYWKKKGKGFKLVSRKIGPRRWFEVGREVPVKQIGDTDFVSDDVYQNMEIDREVFRNTWSTSVRDTLFCRFYRHHYDKNRNDSGIALFGIGYLYGEADKGARKDLIEAEVLFHAKRELFWKFFDDPNLKWDKFKESIA